MELHGLFLIKALTLVMLCCARMLGTWWWPVGQPFPSDISPLCLFAFLKMAEAASWGFFMDVSHCWFCRGALDQETMFLVIMLHMDLFSYAFNRALSCQLVLGLNS